MLNKAYALKQSESEDTQCSIVRIAQLDKNVKEKPIDPNTPSHDLNDEPSEIEGNTNIITTTFQNILAKTSSISTNTPTNETISAPTDMGTSAKQIGVNVTATPKITNVLLKKSDINEQNVRSPTFIKTFVPCLKRWQENDPECGGNHVLAQVNNITDQRNDLIGQGNNYGNNNMGEQTTSAPLTADCCATEVNLDAQKPFLIPNCDLPTANAVQYSHALWTKEPVKEQSIQDICILKPMNSLQPSKSPDEIKQNQHIITNINKVHREMLPCGMSKVSVDTIITQKNEVTNTQLKTTEHINEEILKLDPVLTISDIETNTAVRNYVHYSGRALEDVTLASEQVKTDTKAVDPLNKESKPSYYMKDVVKKVVRKPKPKLEVENRIDKRCDPVNRKELCSDLPQIKPSNKEIINFCENSCPSTLTLIKNAPLEFHSNSPQHNILIVNKKTSVQDQNKVQTHPGPQINTEDKCIQKPHALNKLSVALKPMIINDEDILNKSEILSIRRKDPGKKIRTSDLQISKYKALKIVENSLLLNKKRNNLRKVLNESKVTNEKEINKEKANDVTSTDTNLDKTEAKECSDYSDFDKSCCLLPNDQTFYSKPITTSLKLAELALAASSNLPCETENGSKITECVQDLEGIRKKPHLKIKNIKRNQVVQEVLAPIPTDIQKEVVTNEIKLAQDNLPDRSNMPLEYNKKILNADLIFSSTNNQEEKLNVSGKQQDTEAPTNPLKGTQMILTKVQSKSKSPVKEDFKEHIYYPVITSVQTLSEQETKKIEKERAYNLIEHDYCDSLEQITEHRENQSTQKCFHRQGQTNNGTQNSMQLEKYLSGSVPVTVLPIITSVTSISEDIFTKETDNKEKNMYRCNDIGYIDENIQDYMCHDIGQRNVFDQNTEFGKKELKEINEARIWSVEHYDQASSINDEATLSLVTSKEKTMSADINEIDIGAMLYVIKSNEKTESIHINPCDAVSPTLPVVTPNEETVSVDSISSECNIVDDFCENDHSSQEAISFIDKVCIIVS